MSGAVDGAPDFSISANEPRLRHRYFPSEPSDLLGTRAFTEEAGIGSFPSSVNFPFDNSRMVAKVRSSSFWTMEKKSF